MEYLYIGKIVNTHGIKGELRILSDFEWKEKILIPHQKIYIGKDKVQETILTYRHHKIFEMITLDGYSDINQVLKYKGSPVYIKKEDLVLKENEYLDQDIIGLNVWSNGAPHGVVKQIQRLAKGGKLLQVLDHEKTVLIPYRPEFIEQIDLSAKRIVIKFMEGLFDEN